MRFGFAPRHPTGSFTLILTLLAWLALLAAPAGATGYALEAPERAHIRQAIEVGWHAPDGTGGRIEIRPAAGGRAATYAYVNANPQAVDAPEAPGDYTIVLVHENDVRASRSLSVFLPEASLNAPVHLDAGESFEVAWRGPNSRGDLLTFALRGGDRIRGSSYTYIGNTRGGPGRLRAPMDEGDYDVVYVSGSTILARAPVTVGSVSATLKHAAQVHAGGTLRVIWEGPRNSQDQIRFAVPNGDPMRGGSYAYVANANDNAVALIAPEQTGPLDVVYVSSGRVIGRSPVEVVEARIDLDGPDEVTALAPFVAIWRGAGHHGDLIAVADAAGAYLAYAYIEPDAPRTRLAAPSQAGEFHLVYVTRQGRELARQPIHVLPAPQAPGLLLVEQPRSALGADDAVGVIFDASGSMLQRIDGVPRVAIARQTLAGLVADVIPEGTGFALRVFGHREAGSCRSDLELPLAPLDPATAAEVINGINAKNLARTPLGKSIELAADDLAAASGKRLLIVLTDGEETCDGDPAAAIEGLRARGWDVIVNVVGFAIDDAAVEAEFAAWAALGGGSYFSAADQAGLAAALTHAVATRFRVLDAAGDIAAEGRPGELLTLPPGDYRIDWGTARRSPVTVASGETVRVTLGQ